MNIWGRLSIDAFQHDTLVMGAVVSMGVFHNQAHFLYLNINATAKVDKTPILTTAPITSVSC